LEYVLHTQKTKKQLFQQKYIKCEVSRRELWECQFMFFSL